jgi:hypothetical protein
MTEIVHARKLGELLVDLGVFSAEEIDEIIQIGVQINLPLGRALVLSNRLPEEQLRVILQIQSLIRDDVLDLATARKALAAVKNDGVSLSDALQKLGVTNRKGDEKLLHSKLATLLLDAGVVSKEQVEEAMKVGYETGTPVGRMLVLSGVINHSVLARALEIQVMLRENKMSHGQAVELLKAESLRILPVDQTAEQRGLSKQDANKRVRLGELLMLSGVLTEGDMLNVLELGLTTPKPLGDILKDTGLIKQDVLDMALKLQDMISKGLLDIRAAAAALQEMVSTGAIVDLNECSTLEDGELRLGDLLKQTGLVDNSDIEEAINLSSKYPAMIGKMLVVAGSIDEGTLLAAIRSQFLMRNKALSADDAVQALLYCQRHRISLDDALDELGISIPAPLRRNPSAS